MTDKPEAPAGESQIAPRIVVIGVGGAGGNAVNNMIESKLAGVEFLVANTDAQALQQTLCERTIQLGRGITQGLGAGSHPEVGRAAAEEALEEIMGALEGANMVFITAGMGGGTGTGAAPIIARAAREAGILSVGVVTKPFQFEGARRMRMAEAGIGELTEFVDTLIVIPNQNLFRVANEKTTFAEAFKTADRVLHSGVRGVTDLMVMPGLINLDFADIRSVMTEMGKAIMGTGEGEGERRALAAAEAAISNPLLDDVSMQGARGVLINITGGLDLTLFEVDQAANRIREEVDPEANIIFGSIFDPAMEGKMRVSVVATGIEAEKTKRPRAVPISLVVSQRSGKSISPAGRTEPVIAKQPETPPAAKALPPAETSAAAAPATVAPGPVSTAPLSPAPASPPRGDSGADKSFFQRLAPAKPSTQSAGLSGDDKTPRQASGQPVLGGHSSSSAAPNLRANPAPREAASTAAEAAGEIDAGLIEDETEEPELVLDDETPPRPDAKADTEEDAADGDTTPERTGGSGAPRPKKRGNSIFAWMTGGSSASAEELFDKGDRYYHGQSVRKNLALAQRAYRKAAEMGHAGAQNRLGWMYEKGEGVDADYNEAVKWYRAAAEQGHVNAMNDLGYMFRQGWGVSQNYTDAMHWFRKAAEKYDSYAEYNLGQMYENGWGTEKDMDEAVRWFRRSAARGHEWAAKRLEELGIDT
ncbi:MAG TPA: cell division protein FtsZ [Kiloniellales bacterium]